jgi:hypothetical protein
MIAIEGVVGDVLLHTVVLAILGLFIRLSVRANTVGSVMWVAFGVAILVSGVNRVFFPWVTLQNLFREHITV